MEIPQPKPGWRTTEWAGFFLVIVIALLIGLGIVTEEDALVKVALVLGPALASGLYSMARARTKKPDLPVIHNHVRADEAGSAPEGG